MPRNFPDAIKAEIAKQYGAEPLLVVEVEWADGSFVAYADQKLNGEEYPYPKLVSVGNFDTTRIVAGGSDSQEVSVVLDDIDGSIREIVDEHDVHLNKARISLCFQGVPFEARALMFEGNINSPMVWDEGARTYSFNILSKIESLEAGFTMEDGSFSFVDPKQQNKPWPLVFGEVCNMQTVPITALRKGFLGEGVGIKDPTIEDRLCQARKLQCPTKVDATGEDGSVGGIGGTSGFVNVRQGKPDPACVKRRFDKICEILTEKVQQEQYVKTSFTVRGGGEFPQNQKITILINEVRFDGIMVGETFTVLQVYHPDLDEIDNPPCMDISGPKWGWRRKPSEDDNPVVPAECADGGSSNFDRDLVSGSGYSWDYFNLFERSRFIWLPPGTDVYLAEEAEQIHIVSLLPGTVTQVAAYRNYADTSLLLEVDTDLYTVETVDYTGYDVVELHLTKPLSTIQDEDWDDEIFVSFTSSIGPNPVDIIEWLVEKYTDFEIDTASFASVESDLTDYPTNFFIKSRPSVLELIRDIAYQARCAVYIRDNTVYLVYLSKEPTSIRTLTEDDILSNSFRISHTATEDLETRQTITWSNGEAGVFKSDPTEFDFTLKHNIPEYGLFDADYDWYTMNIFEMVQKSATFWLIRKSKTWKHVEFETPLTHLDLDVFDCVTLNLSQFPTTKVVIEESNYDADANVMRFKAWTPILSGTDSEYYWAWPAAKDQYAIWPLDGTLSGGDGVGITVIPPEGHPLRGDYDPDQGTQQTDGDKYPSDVGDVIPDLECPLATGNELDDALDPDFDPYEPLAERNFSERLNDIESGGTDASSDDDQEDRTACGDPAPGNSGCVYEVTILYVTPQTVTTVVSPGGTCPDAGPCSGSGGVGGRPCASSLHTFCHSFGSLFAATAFHSAKAQEAKVLWDNCRYETGKTDVYQALAINGIPGEGVFSECEEVPDEDNPANDAGQTLPPKLADGDPATAPDPGDL